MSVLVQTDEYQRKDTGVTHQCSFWQMTHPLSLSKRVSLSGGWRPFRVFDGSRKSRFLVFGIRWSHSRCLGEKDGDGVEPWKSGSRLHYWITPTPFSFFLFEKPSYPSFGNLHLLLFYIVLNILRRVCHQTLDKTFISLCPYGKVNT